MSKAKLASFIEGITIFKEKLKSIRKNTLERVGERAGLATIILKHAFISTSDTHQGDLLLLSCPSAEAKNLSQCKMGIDFIGILWRTREELSLYLENMSDTEMQDLKEKILKINNIINENAILIPPAPIISLNQPKLLPENEYPQSNFDNANFSKNIINENTQNDQQDISNINGPDYKEQPLNVPIDMPLNEEIQETNVIEEKNGIIPISEEEDDSIINGPDYKEQPLNVPIYMPLDEEIQETNVVQEEHDTIPISEEEDNLIENKIQSEFNLPRIAAFIKGISCVKDELKFIRKSLISYIQDRTELSSLTIKLALITASLSHPKDLSLLKFFLEDEENLSQCRMGKELLNVLKNLSKEINLYVMKLNDTEIESLKKEIIKLDSLYGKKETSISSSQIISDTQLENPGQLGIETLEKKTLEENTPNNIQEPINVQLTPIDVHLEKQHNKTSQEENLIGLNNEDNKEISSESTTALLAIEPELLGLTEN